MAILNKFINKRNPSRRTKFAQVLFLIQMVILAANPLFLQYKGVE